MKMLISDGTSPPTALTDLLSYLLLSCLISSDPAFLSFLTSFSLLVPLSCSLAPSWMSLLSSLAPSKRHFHASCHLRAIICHLRVATHTPWLRCPTVENSPRGFARTKLDYLNPSSLDDETQADESCCWACSLWGRHMILNPTNTLKTPFLIILKIFTFCTLKYKLGHEVCKALFR